jgi:hypothetical protein
MCIHIICNVTYLRGLVDMGSAWVVVVYNENELSMRAGRVPKLMMADVAQVDEGTRLHLLQNIRTYTYTEMVKEGVIQMFKEMCIVGTQWYNFNHEVLASTTTGKIGQLLS